MYLKVVINLIDKNDNIYKYRFKTYKHAGMKPFENT